MIGLPGPSTATRRRGRSTTTDEWVVFSLETEEQVTKAGWSWAYYNCGRLRWYGLCDEDWVKKCMEYRFEGRRPVGRPKGHG